MGRKLIDLTGKKFGKLTVIKRAENISNHPAWYCNCDCGTENFIAMSSNLIGKRTTSCGCHHKRMTSERSKKYNTYDLSGEYGIGYTSKGEEFYFDLEDYDKIKDYCWFISKNGYVLAGQLNGDKKIRFHKLLFPNVEVDHIHHKKYDNRKSELRIVTRSQNNMNHGLRNDNTSGVTGVAWNKTNNKWMAYITVNSNTIHLGYFDRFKDAVKTRKEAEEKYFGEFSYGNSMNKEGLKYGSKENV